MVPSSKDDLQAMDYILDNRGRLARAEIEAELRQRGYDHAEVENLWLGIEEGLADASREEEEHELRNVTRDWTVPVVVRAYESNLSGEAAFASEAAILARHSYDPSMQSAEGSHLHAGRLLLTGGLSVLAGRRGIRSKGKLTVTFQRRVEEMTTPTPAAARGDPIEQIRKLAELRDAGILTDDEFAAKKAELLSRM